MMNFQYHFGYRIHNNFFASDYLRQGIEDPVLVQPGDILNSHEGSRASAARQGVDGILDKLL
jgi:hypothetical protein